MEGRYGVAIPVSIAAEIEIRRNKIKEDLEKRLEQVARKMAAGNTKVEGERKALIAKLKKLTPGNVIRITTILGAEALAKVSDDKIAEMVAEKGLVRGPKTNAA